MWVGGEGGVKGDRRFSSLSAGLVEGRKGEQEEGQVECEMPWRRRSKEAREAGMEDGDGGRWVPEHRGWMAAGGRRRR